MGQIMGALMRKFCLGVSVLRDCVVVAGGYGPKKMDASFVVFGSGKKQKVAGAHYASLV